MLKIHSFQFWYIRKQWFAIPFVIPLLQEIASYPFPLRGKQKPARSRFHQQSESKIHFQDLGKPLSYTQMFFKFQMSLLCPVQTRCWWSKCRGILSNHMMRASQQTVFQIVSPAWLQTLTISPILPSSVKQTSNAASRFPNFTFLIKLVPPKQKKSSLPASS